MLDGILSRALEIILVLDICGAVVYCLLSGITRSRSMISGMMVRAISRPSSPLPAVWMSYRLRPR